MHRQSVLYTTTGFFAFAIALSMLFSSACKKEDERSFAEKFSGAWKITFQGDATGNLFIAVSNPSSVISLELPFTKNGVIYAQILKITVAENGQLNGDVFLFGNKTGLIKGTLSDNDTGEGNYEFTLGGVAFTGTWTATRTPDPCATVSCGPDASCVNGTCVCDKGLEGSACNIFWSDKFKGNYTASEGCDSGNYSYSTLIQATSATQVTISNFGDFGKAIRATVEKESNTDATARKLIFDDAPANLRFVGYAIIQGNTISGAYRISDGINSDEQCTFTFTK